MDAYRTALYDELESKVVDTPILTLSLGDENYVLVKSEFANRGTQSHYDRVYIKLLRELESEGRIIPGITPLVETSSGSAGEAFAWVCQQADYEALVVAPENAPALKLEAMREYGAELRLTPKRDYVPGAVDVLRTVLTVENEARNLAGEEEYYCPDHSRDERTLEALEVLAEEVFRGLHPINYFVTALGNGASTLGPGKYIKGICPCIQIVGWEPIETGFALEMRSPGEYKELFGIEPGSLAHKLYGTGGDSRVGFPFLQRSIEEGVVDVLTLVASGDSKDKIASIKGDASRVNNYPNWTDVHLRDFKGGHTTLGSIAVVQDMIKRHNLKGQTFLVIGYDSVKKHE
jgi:cysteine synthase